MSETSDERTERYMVLMNHEGQQSLWLSHKPVPAKWTVVKEEGSREECLEYVKRTWVDMRPLSLRKSMGE